jgi:hypothetical protein
MTPTERKILAPYEQVKPSELVGETIAHVCSSDAELILITTASKCIKLSFLTDYEVGPLEFETLTAADLNCLGLVDPETWEQIRVERRANRMLQDQSQAKVIVERLVRAHGADKIRDFLPKSEEKDAC